MNGGKFTTFASGDNISEFSSCNIQGGNVILMERVIGKIFISIFRFFMASKEFLLSSFKILTNSKCSSCENDLIIGLAEVKTILVPISGKTINMVDHISYIWFGWVILVSFRWFLNDLFQEELISFFFHGCFLLHMF